MMIGSKSCTSSVAELEIAIANWTAGLRIAECELRIIFEGSQKIGDDSVLNAAKTALGTVKIRNPHFEIRNSYFAGTTNRRTSVEFS